MIEPLVRPCCVISALIESPLSKASANRLSVLSLQGVLALAGSLARRSSASI
ncbi:hypothetical protein ACS8FD_03840 [Psychrobacter sp. 1U2]|uniref:hypothetical protein n=1 Tax=Psychrobacter sp. 1U2 TaxID=3453577 RepID=UPI003F48D57B